MPFIFNLAVNDAISRVNDVDSDVYCSPRFFSLMLLFWLFKVR